MKPMNRKSFLKQALLGSSFLGLSASAVEKITPTPAETEGPFYPTYPQEDKDFDLTRVKGKNGTAKGTIIEVFGRVIDTEGKPIENVTIDLWQANEAGRYRHSQDTSELPLDPNFQGWAIFPSDKDGKFKFKTIMPGAYAISKKNKRTPHIHFKISKRGYEEIITQMYFPDQELNKSDVLIKRKSKQQFKLMLAKQISENPLTYQHTLILQKV